MTDFYIVVVVNVLCMDLTIGIFVLLQHFLCDVPWDTPVKWITREDRAQGWVSLGDLS